MKKQYTTEVAYDGNTQITFYIDGEYQDHTIISDWKVSGYLEAKEEDGWELAYSHKEMEKAIEEIEGLEDSLTWWKKHLEEIKSNLIGG